MSRYKEVKNEILNNPKTWLITGVAGFIGSNLLESLLKFNQKVIGLDNFATGHQYNLDEVKNSVSQEQWSQFQFINGDIRSYGDCQLAVKDVDYVLHQAALGSVPRSIEDPITSNAANISGFLNILDAAKEEKVKSFTYASSSSTYGDHPALPKIEENIGNPLSPYAVTKYVNELYAQVYARTYGFKSIGLRYFNVFGKRQDPCGAYAAVIPKWTSAILENQEVFVNGDGETSRDFCYIENAIQMNLLAATAADDKKDSIFNVAVGDQTTLNELFAAIKQALTDRDVVVTVKPKYRAFRAGDVRHSQANIKKAKEMLGYSPQFTVFEGINQTMYWYQERLR